MLYEAPRTCSTCGATANFDSKTEMFKFNVCDGQKTIVQKHFFETHEEFHAKFEKYKKQYLDKYLLKAPSHTAAMDWFYDYLQRKGLGSVTIEKDYEKCHRNPINAHLPKPPKIKIA